jgi:hypothetical protein
MRTKQARGKKAPCISSIRTWRRFKRILRRVWKALGNDEQVVQFLKRLLAATTVVVLSGVLVQEILRLLGR